MRENGFERRKLARGAPYDYWTLETPHAGLLEGKHGEGAYAKP
jgi:hypothetical protein